MCESAEARATRPSGAIMAIKVPAAASFTGACPFKGPAAFCRLPRAASISRAIHPHRCFLWRLCSSHPSCWISRVIRYTYLHRSLAVPLAKNHCSTGRGLLAYSKRVSRPYQDQASWFSVHLPTEPSVAHYCAAPRQSTTTSHLSPRVHTSKSPLAIAWSCTCTAA